MEVENVGVLIGEADRVGELILEAAEGVEDL